MNTTQTNLELAKLKELKHKTIKIFGPPGTGKTSTICAIATLLKRRVYKLNLVAPGLCDNSLMEAVATVKQKGIIVMEDVDSLFGKYREKNESFNTTFSA